MRKLLGALLHFLLVVEDGTQALRLVELRRRTPVRKQELAVAVNLVPDITKEKILQTV